MKYVLPSMLMFLTNTKICEKKNHVQNPTTSVGSSVQLLLREVNEFMQNVTISENKKTTTFTWLTSMTSVQWNLGQQTHTHWIRQLKLTSRNT